jgi:hypothetical protein
MTRFYLLTLIWHDGHDMRRIVPGIYNYSNEGEIGMNLLAIQLAVTLVELKNYSTVLLSTQLHVPRFLYIRSSN